MAELKWYREERGEVLGEEVFEVLLVMFLWTSRKGKKNNRKKNYVVNLKIVGRWGGEGGVCVSLNVKKKKKEKGMPVNTNKCTHN